MLEQEIHDLAASALERAWEIRRLPNEVIDADEAFITPIRSIARFYHDQFRQICTFGT